MRKVWIIARQEYLFNVRRAGFIITTLLFPALGLLGLAIAALFGSQATDFLGAQFVPQMEGIGIVDHYGAFTPIPEEYAYTYTAYEDDTAGRAAIERGEIGTLLTFGADYLQTGNVTITSKERDFAVSLIEESDTLREYITTSLLRDQVSDEVQRRIVDPVVPSIVRLEGAGQEPSGTQGDSAISMIVNTMVPYFVGILLVITIFSSSGYLLQSVSGEKTSRVIEIVLSSVTAWELLAGKIIGLGALGLTQIAFWLISASLLSGGAFGLFGIAIALFAKPSLFILSIVYYILGFLIFAVLMGAGGAMGTTQQESQQIAGLFSFMAALPMMIMGFIFANPNAGIARVLSWIPFTAPTMMMLRISLGDVQIVDIIGSIAVCVVTVPALILAGAKVFRASLLMYGSRPKLREIWQIVREA